MFSRFPIFSPLGVYTRCISKATWNACKTTTVVRTTRHFIQMHHTRAVQQQQQCDPMQHTFSNSNNDNTTTNLLFYSFSIPEFYMLDHENGGSFDDGVLVNLVPGLSNLQKSKCWWNCFEPKINLKMQMVGSCNGLLCLADWKLVPRLILNPVVGDYLRLPILEKFLEGNNYRQVLCGFGFDKVVNEYKVVNIIARFCDEFSFVGRESWGTHTFSFEYPTFLFEAQVYTLGSGEWRKLGGVPYLSSSTEFEYLDNRQVFVNGAIHYILEDIFTFHVGREDFQVIPLPHRLIGRDLDNDCLRNFGGYLCLFHESGDQCEIWVMKEYGVQDSWTKEYVIPREGPGFSDASISPVTLAKNGNILVNVKGESLLHYDPVRKSFSTPLRIPEGTVPKFTEFTDVVTHVRSFKSIADVVGEPISSIEKDRYYG